MTKAKTRSNGRRCDGRIIGFDRRSIAWRKAVNDSRVMSPPFDIRIDPVNRMLVTTARGFWSVETVEAFLAAERAAIATLNVEPADLLILFDASRFDVQSQEVIDMLRRPEHPPYKARRAAFITPSGLRKMQIRRGTPDPHIAVFETVEEARRYLSTGMR